MVNQNYYISGSSSKLLSKELGTHLTGRDIYKVICPLSFKEYLSFKNIKYDNKKDLITKKKNMKNTLKNICKMEDFLR